MMNYAAVNSNYSGSSWPTTIPVELYHELQQWISPIQFLLLLNSSQRIFKDIRLFTRRIVLQEEDSKRFFEDESFQNQILFRIKSPYQQLKLAIPSLNFLFDKPMISYSLVILNQLPIIHNEYSFILTDRLDISVKDESHENLTGLPFSLKRVRKLKLVHGPPLDRFCDFNELQEINLQLCDDICDLSYFGHLKKICINSCSFVTSLNGLGKVRHLKITNCLRLTDISDLSSDNYSVYLMFCSNVQDFTPLLRVRNLATDVLKSLSSQDDDWSKVKKLTWFHPPIQSLDFLSHLFEINISFAHSKNFGPTNLLGLGKVSIVTISACEKLLSVDGLGQNQSVTISNCRNLQDFTALRGIPKVHILWCNGFVDGSVLAESKFVSLANCMNLEDVSMLGKCQSLRLARCSKIKNLEGLYEVPELGVLCVEGIPSRGSAIGLRNKSCPTSGMSLRGIGGNQKIVLDDWMYQKLLLGITGDGKDESDCDFPLEKFDALVVSDRKLVYLFRKQECERGESVDRVK